VRCEPVIASLLGSRLAATIAATSSKIAMRTRESIERGRRFPRTSLPMSLNKPAAAGDGGESRWSGTPSWYLRDGGFFAIGRSEGMVPPHAHHAIQIVITVEGTVGIRSKRGDWRMGNGVVVRPDVVHAYNDNGAVGAMLFVDPESLEGVWLRSSLREEITVVPPSRLLSCAGELPYTVLIGTSTVLIGTSP
jgi:hypothetical protein